ncbi:MAG: hypothetical protein ACRECI_12725, partial [Methyloceanibacter sp.]
MLASHPSISERLVEAVIESPQTCIGERALLQSIDWRAVDPAKVKRLLDALAGEGVRLPAWLAKSLVLGGHALPAELQLVLGAPLNALNGLNRAQTAGRSESDVSPGAWGAYLELVEDLEPDIVT